MNRAELVAFVRRHRHAVEASVGQQETPQAAVVGIAVSEAFEIVFDSLATTRKITNLRRNPKVALVVGWDDEQTLQIEGLADEPTGTDLEAAKGVYFDADPTGREREAWPGITYVRVRPTWVRYSDFRGREPVVVELTSPSWQLPAPQDPESEPE